MLDTTAQAMLPADHNAAILVGRVWRPDVAGPAVVALRGVELVDITAATPTMRDLCETPEPAALAMDAAGQPLGLLEEIAANTPVANRDPSKPWLLAPIDLQAVKAAGVTFAVSMLERVIEERAAGDPSKAADIRAEIGGVIGPDLGELVPGSARAMDLKRLLIERGMWSQYLEVGIGPDPEVFTKAQPLSAVGHLAEVGLHPMSSWNNPEPEIVVVVSSTGGIVGATLGNDVNLRDVEGRSALLLGKAKDNNASAAVGPLIRLFDSGFGLPDVESATVTLSVKGDDGFTMAGTSPMNEISRPPADLVAATIGDNHQYPDGMVLYLGTMFAPVQDRGEKGQGFTHKIGDVVTVASERLGALSNRVTLSRDAEPWTFGAAALMRNLVRRGLL